MLQKIKIIIILIVILIAVVGLIFWRGINASINKDGDEKIFIVSSGESVKQIGKKLKDAGLIKSRFYFEVYVWLNEQEKKLQTGEYALNTKMSIKDIIKALTAGEALSKERTIKILEGWRINDIDEYLKKEGIVKGDDFIKLAESKAINWQFSFLKDVPISADLEGYLFPDTYRIFKDAGAKDIIIKMLSVFNKKLTDKMRADIKSEKRTIYETIIMASLVEKEVRTVEDMKIVAGIFWDRIKNGQALQSDATLSYLFNDKVAAHTTRDLEIDSPYNSYKYKGLPPTPISNPGINAIKAAIYPTYTDYNYFFNRLDTGETIFSKTYDEHVRNKNKYLR